VNIALTTTPQLNQSQLQALSNRLFNQRFLPGGVWGPPGTGKTTTASHEAVVATTQLGERVLVTAFQNSTVDLTLRYILSLLNSRFHFHKDQLLRMVCRTGTLGKVAADIQPYHTNNHHRLDQAQIVGVTLHSSYVKTGHRVLDPKSFDRILMDESGQVTPEQAFIPLRLVRDTTNATITAYGDDLQLTPISPDFVPEWSVLRNLRIGNSNAVNMLNMTQRLNYPSVRMTSELFYNGRLDAPDDVKERRLELSKEPTAAVVGPIREAIEPDNPLVYIGVRGGEIEDGLSFDNHSQAMATGDLCLDLMRYGVPAESISVIASYRPHVRSINSVLEGLDIHCSTVHRMLGGENEVVIFATTRSNASRELGFVRQSEFLNVATSRQRRKLIIVGDASDTFAEGSNVSHRMYDFIASHGNLLML
jgi:DNA polymerase III delta prime subunit